MQELSIDAEDMFSNKKDLVNELKCDKTIIVTQISNDITDDWDYAKGKVCMVGLYRNGIFTIFTKDKEQDSVFLDTIGQVIGSMKEVYAFNPTMTYKLLKANFGIDIIIKDIRKVKGVGQSRVKLYKKIVESKNIPNYNLKLEMDFDNVPKYYQEYLNDKDCIGIFMLQAHTYECLIADTLILLHQ